jgi:hypothetical protein
MTKRAIAWLSPFVLFAVLGGVWLLLQRGEPNGDRAAGPGAARYTSKQIGRLCDDIVESSGFAVADGRALWTINDSGPARLWKVRFSGGCSPHDIDGAEVVDWEALAAFEGHLFIGDIGDNLGQRPDIVVYRVASDDPSSGTLTYRFAYPRGPRDAESMMIDPASGDLYIVSKGPRPTIFRAPAPLRAGTTTVLERIGRLGIDEIVPGPTDAAVSSDGKRIVFVTYLGAYEIDVEDRTFADALLEGLRGVALPVVEQREAVTYGRTGRSFYWTSEGVGPPLYVTRLR